MKERFLLAVSWGALAWFLFCCYAVGMLIFVDGMAIYDVFERNLLLLIISPAVWLVLWIVTGSPRILPWRK